MSRLLSSTVLVTLLTGCSWIQQSAYELDAPTVAKTVKMLPPAEMSSVPMAQLSLKELVQQLEQIENDALAYEVTNRLAQLRLELMQDQLAEGEADFFAPMAALHRLKAMAKDKQSKAQVDYQLARVLDLSRGQETVAQLTVLAALSDAIKSTDSAELELESRFRRAEIHFSNEAYALAAQDFARVAAVAGQYQLHARYMLSWVRFKVADLDGALQASTSALSLLAESEDHQFKELQQDVLRVAVLALDYSDGPATLAGLMFDAGKPAWQTDLYRALGDWYLSKTRFADSARTWQTFLTENPVHAAAPSIALEVINTQRAAGFVAEIPDLEQDFITRYGRQTDFFALHGEAVFDTYQASLRDMLDRFTQRLHAAAQDTERRADYLLAAGAYEVWLSNFAESRQAQEKRFLYAEVVETALGFASARPQYERVVSMKLTSTFGREAAYALVLGYDNDVATFGIDALIQANLRFAQFYPEDLRAAACQLNAAKHLFDQGKFAAASDAAVRAVSLSSDTVYQRVARRLVAHSAFELAAFARAETAYRELLALGDDAQDRLLASVYKQGESAEHDGQLETAISHYQRLAEIDPAARLTRDSAYDIAALYERLDRGDLAITQLDRYRQRYPQQAQNNADEISRRLVRLKESTGDLTGAAAELIALGQRLTGAASGVARYRAAELYLQAGQLDQAIEHFRYYAHNFTTPVAVQIEAMHHMDVLYQQTDEPVKRGYWLRKQRDVYKTLAQTDRTDRAKYLAANAIYVLSENAFQAFRVAKLTQPLAKTLKHKQALLATSLKNYAAVIEVGAFEYVTLSQWRMAQHYEVLAIDLMSSELPYGLNELEREQYQILLEEQAYPFEEKAISLHQKNLRLGWQVSWNDAVNESLLALQALSPAQFRRPVQEVSYVNAAE